MNTLAHIAALVALGWLTKFMFVDQANPVVGFAVFAVALLFLPLTWFAVHEDREILSGGDEE